MALRWHPLRARAPVGSLRWQPPQPVEPWSGLFEATQFGPIAPQGTAPQGLVLTGDASDQREDCLSLNVWTPALDAGRRPVMVWIHGGGFTGGSGGGLLYHGDTLAERGDVVVVTINYRLGALGFLAHPSLDPPSGPRLAGNWGLLDQIAALEWVRDHIDGFGGDPHNVTLFGESAGGMSVSALLAAPLARGLFHKAIIESGPPFAHSLDHARHIGEELANILDVPRPTREDWESVPAGELVAAVQVLESRPVPPGRLPLPFLPVVDGGLLDAQPYETVLAGAGASVPLMIGTNRDELTLFALNDPRLGDLDETRLEEWASLAVPGAAALEAIEIYRQVRGARHEPVAPRDLWIAMGTDLVFRWPSLRLASAHQVRHPGTFVYLFTWETPVLGGILGAAHALEIPFVFGRLDEPLVTALSGGGPEAERLSTQMLAAWTAFAHEEIRPTRDLGFGLDGTATSARRWCSAPAAASLWTDPVTRNCRLGRARLRSLAGGSSPRWASTTSHHYLCQCTAQGRSNTGRLRAQIQGT